MNKKHGIRYIAVLLLAFAALAALFSLSASADGEYTAVCPRPALFAERRGGVDVDRDVDVDGLRQCLLDGLKSYSSSIDVSAFGIEYTDEGADILKTILFEELIECFHLDYFSISYGFSNGVPVIRRVDPVYRVTKDEYLEMQNEVDAAIAVILSGIKDNPALGQVEKALLVHDRLALGCEYDYDSYNNQYYMDPNCGNLYGALVNRLAVCQGYAEAYSYLLDQLGIDGYICSSVELNHAWNIIYVDGVAYHVDVTWDDVAWGNNSRGAVGSVGHENFLRSTDGMVSTKHDADDYDTTPNDTRYDKYFWQDVDSAFQLVGGELYYIDNDAQTLNRYSDRAKLISVEDKWRAGFFSTWRGNWACLSGDGHDLYYSQSEGVYKFNPVTGRSERIFTPKLSGFEAVYSFAYLDGSLVCDVNVNPPYMGTSALSQQSLDYEHETSHSYGEWTVLTQPTCAADGTRYRSCLICAYTVTESIPATHAHLWSEYEVTADPTCTAPGSQERVCAVCGCDEREDIPALGHSFGEWSVTTDPTCYSGGEEKRTCLTCGTPETRELEPAPHTEVHVPAKDPTCVDMGNIEYYYCTVCDYHRTVDGYTVNRIWVMLPPTDMHTFGEWITAAHPTCVEQGKKVRACLNCIEFETRAIPATGEHSFGEWSVMIEPTCVEQGEEKRTCLNCDAFETQPVPATDAHSFGEWSVTSEPTCSEVGTASRTCTACGYGEYKDIPATGEHSFGDWETIKQPTATEKGEQIRECTVCGSTESKELDVIAPPEPDNPFVDVKEGKWYTSGVLYCYSNGYMTGVSDDTFDYKATMDRQMFATILAKIDGADTSAYTEMSFTDVKAGQWYSNAIEWAYQNGYASGIGEGIYGRKNPVTREQMAMFFYTYSEKNGIDVSGRAPIEGYSDYGRVHGYALEALAWAVDAGLISGTSDTTLSPRDSATRGQVAVIVNSYAEKVKNSDK